MSLEEPVEEARDDAVEERDQALAKRDKLIAERDQLSARLATLEAAQAQSAHQIGEQTAEIATLRKSLQTVRAQLEQTQHDTQPVYRCQWHHGGASCEALFVSIEVSRPFERSCAPCPAAFCSLLTQLLRDESLTGLSAGPGGSCTAKPCKRVDAPRGASLSVVLFSVLSSLLSCNAHFLG